MRSCRHRGDSCARGDGFHPLRPVFHDYGIRGNGPQTSTEPDFHAPADQQTMGESGQRSRYLGKNPFAALQQNQPQIGLCDVVVGADSLAQKVVHFRYAFDPRKSAAGHDERKKPFAAFRIALGLRFLQHPHQLIAQVKCVSKILEWTGMFAHSGNLRVI